MTRSSRQTRLLARKLSKLTEAQAAMGWGLILLVVTLVGVIYLGQSSRIATVGRQVQALQYDVDTIQIKNKELERDIAQAQALTRIRKEADAMGFVPAEATNIEYVIVPNYPAPVALNEVQEPAELGTTPLESMREAIWLALEAKLSDLIRGEALEDRG